MGFGDIKMSGPPFALEFWFVHAFVLFDFYFCFSHFPSLPLPPLDMRRGLTAGYRALRRVPADALAIRLCEPVDKMALMAFHGVHGDG